MTFAPPGYPTASGGARISLWPGASTSKYDYALGVASNVLWSGVAAGSVFSWYGDNREYMRLLTAGQGLHVVGNAAGTAAELVNSWGLNITVPDGNAPLIVMTGYAGAPAIYSNQAGGTGASPSAIGATQILLGLARRRP